MNIKLGLPELTDLKPRITVIGVGGAGCNAINNMIATELDGVEFVVANTDSQSLAMSNAERRIQLGVNLTEGLGAGAKPEIGEAAAREAEEEIRAEIAGSHMVFIAAGMGGGTGTGAASVVAEIARDLGILTVGIVSKPFQFEGTRRMRAAEDGIKELESAVDTLIVIPNQNLFRVANERTTIADAFLLADQVLYSGIACIVDLIVKEGLINLDFADVRAVMKGMGSAMMGTGEATGEGRAMAAATEAISNPLLDNVSLAGAQGLLVSIVGGSDLTLYEVDTAVSHVRKEVAADANIIFGATTDDTMGDRIRVAIVASGISGAKAESAPAAVEQRPAIADQPAASAAAAPEFLPEDPALVGDGFPPLPAEELPPTDSRSGEPEMDDREADAFARALSEAMRDDAANTDLAEAGHPDGQADQDQPAAPSPSAWRSSDGVVVEEGFAGDPVSQLPPPLPKLADLPSNENVPAFEPRPPAQRNPHARRVPDVTDFPEIAQREYFAKMEAEQAGYVGADDGQAVGQAGPAPEHRAGAAANPQRRRQPPQTPMPRHPEATASDNPDAGGLFKPDQASRDALSRN